MTGNLFPDKLSDNVQLAYLTGPLMRVCVLHKLSLNAMADKGQSHATLNLYLAPTKKGFNFQIALTTANWNFRLGLEIQKIWVKFHGNHSNT